ncbi:MAG: hypothetical protein ACXU9C_21420 [Xanthobacteraceae bacterium]
MPDLGCRLERVSVEHPDGTALAARLEPFLDDRRVFIARGNEVRVRAMIMTPAGSKELS